MPKILTYNVTLESNLSYAHTFNRLIDNLKGYEWLYGAHGYNGPIRNSSKYTLVSSIPNEYGFPKHLKHTLDATKPDILFMHDDIQRTLWLKQVKTVPTVLWVPWDNEDVSLKPAYEACKGVDMVVSVAKFGQKMLHEAGIPAMQIYNPVDSHIYKPDPKAGKEFREKVGIKEDYQIVTWIGRPGWRKRFFHIIEIVARLRKLNPKIHLLLHTDFNDPALGFKPEEILWARNMLEGDAVFWPGDFNFAQGWSPEILNGIYNATDVYIAPHAGEGMGLPIVEAMACGKPFIATDYSTTQEFAGYKKRGGEMMGTRGMGAKIGHMIKDKGVMRPFVDIDDFVKKTYFLLNNPEIRDQMGKEGRKFVLRECSSQAVGAKWKLIFDDMTQVNTMGFKHG